MSTTPHESDPFESHESRGSASQGSPAGSVPTPPPPPVTAPWTQPVDRAEEIEQMFPTVNPYPAPPAPASAPAPVQAQDPVTSAGAPTAAPAREIARGPRPGTVVWGLLVIAAGIVSIVAATGVALDLELTAIVGLAVAGVLLLGTALVSATRRRGRD